MVPGYHQGGIDDLRHGLTVEPMVAAGIVAGGALAGDDPDRPVDTAASPVQRPPVKALLRVIAGVLIEPSN